MFDDRPAFVQVIDYDYGIVDLDERTVVIIDQENKSCNIILKKGGEKTMIKTVEQVKPGWEKVYEDVLEFERNLEERIRQQMAEELEAVKRMKADCVKLVKIEVPDEEEITEEVTEEVTVEENV